MVFARDLIFYIKRGKARFFFVEFDTLNIFHIFEALIAKRKSLSSSTSVWFSRTTIFFSISCWFTYMFRFYPIWDFKYISISKWKRSKSKNTGIILMEKKRLPSHQQDPFFLWVFIESTVDNEHHNSIFSVRNIVLNRSQRSIRQPTLQTFHVDSHNVYARKSCKVIKVCSGPKMVNERNWKRKTEHFIRLKRKLIYSKTGPRLPTEIV